MRFRHFILLLGGAAVFLAAWMLAAPVQAAPQPPAAAAAVPDPAPVPNSRCLECHGRPGLMMRLEDSSILDLFINTTEYNQSIHGTIPLQCVDCHVGMTDYGPNGHDNGFSAENRRAATIQFNETCAQCHEEQSDLVEFSIHEATQHAGNLEAAVCSDCHTSHGVRRLTDPQTGELTSGARVIIPQMCARCHNAIFQKYAESVHGEALLDENNRDVPTCIDCHGVHNIGDPTTASFRLFSPQMCAGCHTDAGIMDKYGISTNVLNTYVADFHGTTVTIFENVAPDAATNKPVCFDCHGVHDITRTDDPLKGLQVRENLQARCEACHPDADVSFPEAWLSHYIPTPDKYPIVYYVNLFYKFFIPAVLGGMGLMVVMDIGRSLLNRYRGSGLAKKLGRSFRRVEEFGRQDDEEAHHG